MSTKFTGLSDFKKSKKLEWLETNGLGGYASGTVSGANTRKYHGVLIASVNPPVERMVVLSKLEETIVDNDNRYALGTNQYPGAVYPEGYKFLTSYERELFPVFYYGTGAVQLKKTIAAVHGENTTLIMYEVIEAVNRFNLEFLPLYNCRDFHSLAHQNENIGRPYLFDEGVFRTLNYRGCPEIFISVPGSDFIEHSTWYNNFEYLEEQARGLDFKEDLYTHGKFSVSLAKGDKLGIIVSTHDPTRRDAFEMFAKEQQRRERLVKDFSNDTLRRLALAADQFVVKRGALNTIIAGYPWFADWGRDTMISLTGICLVTKRFSDAKNILIAFSKEVNEGMLPNRFTDYGEAPEYNTVDATLWFFLAIYQYHFYTKDLAFVELMLPCLEDIIAWHYKGTRYHIHVDPDDELVYAGQDGIQLTWMDAKVDDWVVTPRKGKPVEINALWYNALNIMSYFYAQVNNKTSAELYARRADKVKGSFVALFWNDHENCLYDFIDGSHKNADIRPNQLYAISLPFTMLPHDQAQKVLTTVKKHLLTPYGLRSLSPANKNYKSFCDGTVRSRDGAYHQGTVWSFLIGPYIDSVFNVKGDAGMPEAKALVSEFLNHLDDACVGSVSEIFDGDAPHTPRGCFAQAWGVAEVFRVVSDHRLIS